jgi:hypothetical protein
MAGGTLAATSELPLDPRADVDHLNLVSDVVLAGIVTCDFAVFDPTTQTRSRFASRPTTPER